MEVTLVSHSFDTRIRGVGSYSQLIYDSLELKGVKLNTIAEEDAFLPYSSRLSYPLYSAIDLKRLMRRFKNSDVYHSLSPNESLYIPKNKGVCSVLDFIPFTQINSMYSKINAKFFNKCIKSAVECEKIIVINPDLKEVLTSRYNAEASDIEVISPPIDNKYYPLNKNNDSFVIGTVSELSKRKRVDVLIKSFLEADIENSKLLIGGGGSELEYLKKLANGDERIEFLGFVPDEKMNEFYNSLDLFVFPTRIEGYGMPIVEAMACAKPVITLEDAQIPSNLKEKTFTCSKEELADVLSNRTYFCDIKKNIEFFKEHSIENIGPKLLKVYESI